MTYCVGIKYCGSIYLIGDSARTTTDVPEDASVNFLSSVGELQEMQREGFVEEALLKLIPVANDTVIAIAGNVALAVDIVNFIKDELKIGRGIEEAFKSAVINKSPFAPGRDVEMLIAYAPQGKEDPSLYHWSTRSSLKLCNEDIVDIGGLDKKYTKITEWAFRRLVERKWYPDILLPILTGLIQSYGLHYAMMQHGVGGTVFGLRMKNGNYAWQDDTTYILYKPAVLDSTDPDWFKVSARDNVLAVSSSLTSETRVFYSNVSTPDIDTWYSNWGAYMKAAVKAGPGSYWVLLDTINNVICLIQEPNSPARSKYIMLKILDERKFQIKLQKALIEELKKIYQDSNEKNTVYRFKFLNRPFLAYLNRG